MHQLEQNQSERARFSAMDDNARDAYRETVTAITGSLPTWAEVTPHPLDDDGEAKSRYEASNGAMKAGYRNACIDLTGALPVWARTVTARKRTATRSKPAVTEQSGTVTEANGTVTGLDSAVTAPNAPPDDPLAHIDPLSIISDSEYAALRNRTDTAQLPVDPLMLLS